MSNPYDHINEARTKSFESTGQYLPDSEILIGPSSPTPVIGFKFDTGKLQYSLIPPETTQALAEVLTFGASKYAPNNWQIVENAKQRYLDALYRHLTAFRLGEELDPESGLHHLSHALTNVAFLHYLHTTKKDNH